jgi:hypothetical protein
MLRIRGEFGAYFAPCEANRAAFLMLLFKKPFRYERRSPAA